MYVSGFNTPENDPGRQVALPTWQELLARDDANKDGAIQKEELSDARTKRYWEFIDTEGHGKIVESEWNLHLAVMAAENGSVRVPMGARGDATGKAGMEVSAVGAAVAFGRGVPGCGLHAERSRAC